MKQFITIVIVFATCFLVPLSARSVKEEDGVVRIDLESRLQTNEGWGVSLCWWANMCGRYSEQHLDSLIDWLVSPEGLNYNIFRYNIGGGDDPQWTHCQPHHFCYPRSGKGYRAEMEGFQDERGGAYHWERDSAQIRILRMIKKKRPDAIFEAFSNSAPWWMTLSGCVGGNRKASDDNINPAYYEDFAHYLVDVCQHFKEAYGIEFATLDPFNEPVTDYWKASGSQEGCHVSTEAQIAFLKVLHPILKASGLKTVISASDETSVGQSLTDLHAYAKADILSMVGQWNTHTYQGSKEDKKELASYAHQLGVRLWQSETGDGGKGIEGNLKMALRLIEDVKYLQAVAWCDWQYVEENHDQWSLVKCDHIWNRYERHANYYVRQHFSRYIPVGYTFLHTDSPSTLSAISPDGKELVLVSVNATREAKSLQFSLPKGFSVKTCVRSSSEGFGQTVSDFKQQKQQLSFQQPAFSISTFVLDNKLSRQ